MATVHFLYRSVRSKASLEVRLQHTQRKDDKIKNFLWNAKTQIEVTKDFWENQYS